MTLPPFFIGRFQPFHLGHLDAIKQILARYDKVIIGIGSSQHHDEPKNPFPVSVRRRMIKKSLTETNIRKDQFTIIEIPDIYNDDKWVAHVERLCPPFDEIVSGTPFVQKLFKKDGKHNVVSPLFNLRISATEIRERMAKGEPWENLVPGAVVKIIQQYNKK